MMGTVDTRHPPDLRREDAAGVDHDVSLEGAAIGAHAAHAAALDLDACHGLVDQDPGAPGPGAGSQGVGQVGGIEPAVGGQEHRAQDARWVHEREALLRLLRRQEFQGQTEGARPADLALQLLVPCRTRCQTQRADLVPRDIDARLGRQTPVELGAVHHHPGQGRGAAQLADETRRMERRAAGQARALEQHDVRPAELRKVVGHARAADAAADDDGLGVLDHARWDPPPRGCLDETTVARSSVADSSLRPASAPWHSGRSAVRRSAGQRAAAAPGPPTRRARRAARRPPAGPGR